MCYNKRRNNVFLFPSPHTFLGFNCMWGRGTDGPPLPPGFAMASTGPERHLLVVLGCRLWVSGNPGVWDTRISRLRVEAQLLSCLHMQVVHYNDPCTD